jgi:hypothetical protein
MKKVSANTAAKNAGYRDALDACADVIVNDQLYPACCEDGCEVEVDGYCEHGHPSIALEIGIV